MRIPQHIAILSTVSEMNGQGYKTGKDFTESWEEG